MPARTDQLIRTIEIKDRTGRVTGTKEVVTYQGLLSKAHEEGLAGIQTQLLQIPGEDNNRTAIAKAVVVTGKGSFEGLGDASPDNVSSFIAPHLIRMAETRAKARALRDAVNVGVISFEELDGGGLDGSSSDLGSGATPRNGGPKRTLKAAEKPAASVVTPPAGNGADIPMSEAQRRYLFRLLAAQGLEGEAAHDTLKEMLHVESLKDVTRRQATVAIDRLLKGAGEEAVRGAA